MKRDRMNVSQATEVILLSVSLRNFLWLWPLKDKKRKCIIIATYFCTLPLLCCYQRQPTMFSALILWISPSSMVVAGRKGVGRGWEGGGRGFRRYLIKNKFKKKAVFAICALVNPSYSLNLFLLNPRWKTLLSRSEVAFSELPNTFWSFLRIRLFYHPGMILHGFNWAGWKNLQWVTL